MSIYNGILEPSIFVEDTLRCSATIQAAPVSPVSPLYKLESIIPLEEAARGRELPIAYEFGRIGKKVKSFLDDYYYRIHVTKSNFDFGAIFSERIDTFMIWNAFFNTITCTNIDRTEPDEYGLSGKEVPFDYKALQYSTYIITIYKEGSIRFEASIIFDFGSDGIRTILLSGIRLIIFGFCPHWPVKESLEWLTDIIVPSDGIGAEQRISVRPIPRQSFSLNIALKTEKLQSMLEAALFMWQKRMFGLPLWTEKILHTMDINTNDETIEIDTTCADFRNESYAIIWKSPTEYEAFRISTIENGLLILESPIIGTFTGNKYLMPLRLAQVSSTISKKNPVTRIMLFTIDFAIKDNIILEGFAPDVTYKDITVLQVGSKQINKPDKESESDSDSFIQDYGGDFDFLSDSEFNILTQSWGILNKNKAECWQFRLLLHSLFGRQGVLFAPTYKKDLSLAETIGPSDTSFQIENIKLSENMKYNYLRAHLAFIFPGGEHIYREITGIIEHDSFIEFISIDSPLGKQVNPGDCMISFLDKVRLTSDIIDIEWPKQDTNYVNLPFIAVVN